VFEYLKSLGEAAHMMLYKKGLTSYGGIFAIFTQLCFKSVPFHNGFLILNVLFPLEGLVFL